MKFSKMLAAITQVLNQDSDTQVDVCMTSEMARRIELWTAMYEDNAPWVDRKKVKSAQLPAAIACKTCYPGNEVGDNRRFFRHLSE